MGKIPNELREAIARNIRECRMKKFPGRGGGKKCAESFGVSPQQWSPWERGMRTPDELRLSQIAEFFGVSVEYLRRDNTRRSDGYGVTGNGFGAPYGSFAGSGSVGLQESEAPPYGLPSLRRDDSAVSPNSVAELAMITSRLMGMIGATAKGVADGKLDITKTIVALRRLGELLDHRLREAEGPGSNPPSF